MTYTYKCENCGEYEVEESMKAEPHTECPICGSPVKRVIRNAGVIVKCSGFFGKSNG